MVILLDTIKKHGEKDLSEVSAFLSTAVHIHIYTFRVFNYVLKEPRVIKVTQEKMNSHAGIDGDIML